MSTSSHAPTHMDACLHLYLPPQRLPEQCFPHVVGSPVCRLMDGALSVSMGNLVLERRSQEYFFQINKVSNSQSDRSVTIPPFFLAFRGLPWLKERKHTLPGMDSSWPVVLGCISRGKGKEVFCAYNRRLFLCTRGSGKIVSRFC